MPLRRATSFVAALWHAGIRLAVEAERRVLQATGGTCRAPVGALASVADRDFTMIVGGAGQFLLFMAIYMAGNWPDRPWVKDHVISIVDTVPAMAFKAGLCVFAGLVFVWPAVERRRHLEEWASLPVEPAS